MRRRRILLALAPLIAGGPGRAERFPADKAIPVRPPGAGLLLQEPRLPPWPPTRWNPVWRAESAVGRRLPQDLRHAMRRDARRLRVEATAVHDRWLAEVAQTAALAPGKAARRLGLPRSPYRPSADVARLLGAPPQDVEAAQARRLARLEALHLSLAEAWSRALDVSMDVALAFVPPIKGAP
jgi:hypothetical protein